MKYTSEYITNDPGHPHLNYFYTYVNGLRDYDITYIINGQLYTFRVTGHIHVNAQHIARLRAKEISDSITITN